MKEFDKVTQETVKFMRGKYRLDEVAGMYYDNPCIRFKQGQKTIVTIILHDDHYDFLIVLGKAEREKFEAARHEFPREIQELYDRERTFHDGKWLLIRVDNLIARVTLVINRQLGISDWNTRVLLPMM